MKDLYLYSLRKKMIQEITGVATLSSRGNQSFDSDNGALWSSRRPSNAMTLDCTRWTQWPLPHSPTRTLPHCILRVPLAASLQGRKQRGRSAGVKTSRFSLFSACFHCSRSHKFLQIHPDSFKQTGPIVCLMNNLCTKSFNLRLYLGELLPQSLFRTWCRFGGASGWVL